MYAIRLTHGASTVEIKISPCDSYVTNLCTILQTLALKEPSDSEQQQQQLAFKYSLQHVEKNSQNFYLEASMFGENTNNMFWNDTAKEGDEFVLRNEYERVEAKLKLLREALSEATEQCRPQLTQKRLKPRSPRRPRQQQKEDPFCCSIPRWVWVKL